jgi:diguanylate cyclase (GGDEF)-like protein/PAS domain S-box-containing protein
VGVPTEAAAIQRRFHAEFWRAPAAIAAIGFDSILLACNAAFGEILGIDPSELVGVDAATFVNPEEVEQAVAESVARIEADRTDETRPKPIRMVRHDGAIVWVQFDSVIVDDDPTAPYVLATMTDVSSQVEIQQALDQSDAWFRTLLEHQSDIVTVVDFDGTVRYISPNCERLLGLPADELVGTSGFADIHPDDLEGLAAGFGAQLNNDLEVRPIEYRQRCRDGSWLWLEATVRQIPADVGPTGLIVNARDVSERRRADEAAREAENRFRSAFAASPLGIVFADLNGRFTWVNQAVADTVGIPASQLLEMSFADFINGEEATRQLRDARLLLDGKIDAFSCEKRYEHPVGGTIWARLYFSLVRDADGAPAQLLCQLEDITERKQREMSLTHDALHDPLTGLLNRAGLREHVDRAWSARTDETPVAVLFGDLDGFKGVNDRLGHDAGDEVLVHVAERLRTAVRSADVVARWGGDEFVVLCPTVAGVDDAMRIASRIRIAIETPFRVGQGLAEIGISVGVALDTGQPLPDLLIKDADAAAYRAKKIGRNRVVVA